VSARLALRQLTPADVTERYVAWLNDDEVNRYLESRFAAHTLATTRGFVEAMEADGSNVLLGVFLTHDGRHIGNIKIGPIDAVHRSADVGLLIGERDEWGKGYATEAIGLATEYAFSVLDLRKLTAGCYEQNLGSARAFEKAGWRREGTRRRQFVSDGRRVDEILLGVVAPEA
jgi:ribosomal-protein-alanine N-acetyltransferase